MNALTTTATATGLGIALVLMGQTSETHLSEAISSNAGPFQEIAGPATILASAWHGAGSGSAPEHADRLPVEMLHGVDGATASEVSAATLTEVVQQYCQVCHNDVMMTGNLSLSAFEVERATERAETAEKMIVKLRAGMMPPPGMPRPSADTLQALVETLETSIDEAAARNPNPGSRTFQRLNRAEYEASIRGLLGLEVDAGQYLPLDTKSANFDNIADVQMLSPTLLDAYLNGASEISRLALGDRDASAKETLYHLEKRATQMLHVEGTPYGSRGGISVVHTFPADGEYVFWFQFEAVGKRAEGEQLELSFDGERVALLDMDLSDAEYADPGSTKVEIAPIFVRAGPKRISAAFVKKFEGPVEEIRAPLGRSVQGGWPDLMLTTLPHLRDLAVAGPYNVTGVSETASRERIFICRPTSPSEERPCAEEIITELASDAYRRPSTDQDLRDLMSFYEEGETRGGFESGIRFALQAILASPHFVFRFEEAPAGVDWEEPYRLTDMALASRLSFFLWGSPPDEELTDLAQRRRLSDSGVFEGQVRRLLEDPRSEALATRFASQWLRLQDMDKVSPDQYTFPYFDMSLSDAMRRETELFFYNLVREDRSIMELLTGDYTFVNERLAQHYGIPNVAGSQFRRVPYPDDRRRGLLGQGSILMLTSMANRTSPVLRGKWVMEVILNAPPPPPPPDVPALESTEEAVEGRFLTTGERMEKHRENPTCYACHQFMDPMGLALDNFDVTGKWRIRENGMPLDTRGLLYDGTPLATPADLSEALLKRPIPFVRAFTANLMAYALGRRVEYYDQPMVRAISREAEANDYRISSFIMAVVTSDQFQMKGPPQVVVEEAEGVR